MISKPATYQLVDVPLPETSRVIAIGASAGGLGPLLEVLAILPKDLSAALIVATHLGQKSMMTELISRICPMTVVSASEVSLQNSTVYVAKPGYHLEVDGNQLRLLSTPPIRFLRPNLSLLFESVGKSFGPRSVGVVLSGMGRDGAEGLRAIKKAGGTTVVEDPRFAEFPEMPAAALETNCVDWTLSSDRIGEILIQLCARAPSLLNG